MNISDVIQNNIFCVRAGGSFTGVTGCPYNFVYGHSYKIIAKIKTLPTGSDKVTLFAYKTSSNTPNVIILDSFTQSSVQMQEGVYTHNKNDTYAYVGCYGSSDNSRNGRNDIVLYIEDIT